MKINEVAILEATPNYEVDPTQSRLSAIAVKLMDKSKETTDINLGIALARVATHLQDYGSSFGARSIPQLLDMVNGEGRYSDPDMPQDNKNPIKVTKESLMKMMAYGQKMVDKEGTVQPDIKEAEDYHYSTGERYSDSEKNNARRMIKQLRAIGEHRRILENMIIKLAEMNKDSGDLTDQLQTMFDLNTKFSGVVRRALKIVPVYEGEMNEAIPTSEFDYDLMKFYKKVQELEDENQHGEVAEMLTMLYGNDSEAMVIRGINGMHSRQGSIYPEQQKLRDMISNKYYKQLEKEIEELKRTSPAYTLKDPKPYTITGEGVISDLFKSTTAEKRSKEATASAYDAMRLEKETKKFAKQGLSPDDARKYAYRKVYGAPKEGVGESSFGDRSLAAREIQSRRIAKDVDKGMSMDAIVGKYANKGTTNTDSIRKMVRDYKFKSRMKK
mgnify:CR=1 FL=1|tara:strand:- start:40 stop:1365 length:1326 start_codon:yes stop_codon:yes gene_type:complete